MFWNSAEIVLDVSVLLPRLGKGGGGGGEKGFELSN